MREIKLTWDLATDVLTVDSFERISRGVAYHLRLFIVRYGAAEMLPAGSVILALAKSALGGEMVLGCNAWTAPTRVNDPYTGTLGVGGEALDGLFGEGEKGEVELLFQLTHRPDLESLPSNSQLLPLVVLNDLERDDDVMPSGPVESPFALADGRYVRYDVTVALDGADQVRAQANIGIEAATETVVGLVKLATVEEVLDGVDASRAVTSAGVAAAIANIGIEAASDTVAGVVELATVEEVLDGVDASRAVTSEGVAAAIANAAAVVGLAPLDSPEFSGSIAITDSAGEGPLIVGVVDGAGVFTVLKNGSVEVAETLYAANVEALSDVKGVYLGANYAVQIAGNAQLSAPDWGVVCLTDQFETDLSRLCLGSSSSANPALAVDGPGVVVRLADDSADTVLRASRLIMSDVPTSNPGVPGMIWSDGGILKIS